MVEQDSSIIGRNYQYVWEQARGMMDAVPVDGTRAARPATCGEEAWKEFVLSKAFDASGTHEKCAPYIGGWKPSKQRLSEGHHTGRLHEKRLRKLFRLLQKHGEDQLLVAEPPVLEEFGIKIGQGSYNLQTLGAFEALNALDCGGVLGGFRDQPERKTVWQLGVGRGEFAYQFKTLCSNITYFITDSPEAMLFAGVYLKTAFPRVRFAFIDESNCGALKDSWDHFDFVFLPKRFVDEVQMERLELAISMGSFQEPTPNEAKNWVEKLYERDCPFLYSLNQDRLSVTRDATNVSETLRRFYWIHEIPPLCVNYQKIFERPPDVSNTEMIRDRAKMMELQYRHIIGWRRIMRVSNGRGSSETVESQDG